MAKSGWSKDFKKCPDGIRVLLFNDLWDMTFGAEQIGMKNEDGWEFESGMDISPGVVEDDTDGLTAEDYAPTHWMPLPDRPASAA